jgi:outer membrane receptor protein involved in Fe transport
MTVAGWRTGCSRLFVLRGRRAPIEAYMVAALMLMPGLLREAPAQPQTPVPAGSPGATVQSDPAPAGGQKAGTMLPTITVTAKRTKPQTKPRANPAATTTTPATAQPAPQEPPAAPSGAPNIAAGPAAVQGMASQMRATGDELNARPVTRPGEIVEAAPGLIVTQHSGEGKANQYFLRGYNLDHGTDLAITVDDVPINMRTHAHGQGYSDLNFLMPETVNAMDIRKGPYFADVGDFGSAGALSISLVDTTPKKVATMTVGSFGYERLFGMGSTPAAGGNLFFAGEMSHYNGPWDNPDDARKVNGLVRYTLGTATDGLSVTGMAYSNKWNSTDQVPLRALQSGVIDRFGALDPTDGGNAERFSLSARMVKSEDNGFWKANFYAAKSTLDLYNDFTWDLTNSGKCTIAATNCDQFHQHDGRFMTGGNASRTFQGAIGGIKSETTFGIQTRYDDIDLGLSNTFQREFVSAVRFDHVSEASAGIYAENTLYWTDWLRTTTGWRGDYYDATVNSLLDANNSGHTKAAIGSPKFRLALGPFYKTEFFFGAGMGFHSNDARGATITESPVDPASKLNASPLLVRTRGFEAGVRTKIVPDLDSSVSLFVLDQASEILFSGDAGDTSASRPSERYGVEWTNHYRPRAWIDIEADLAATHARFIGFDQDQANAYAKLAADPLATPQVLIGNAAGNFIPNAPAVVASAGITLGEATGWFGGLRWRYLGPSPLTEDGAFRSPPTSLFNGRLGYRFDNGWRIQLDALNLLNTKTNQINYAYGSLLPNDKLYQQCIGAAGPVPSAAVCQSGVMDYILHPVEPFAIRLSLTGTF